MDFAGKAFWTESDTLSDTLVYLALSLIAVENVCVCSGDVYWGISVSKPCLSQKISFESRKPQKLAK